MDDPDHVFDIAALVEAAVGPALRHMMESENVHELLESLEIVFLSQESVKRAWEHELGPSVESLARRVR